MRWRLPDLFLSHAAVDKDLAQFLEQALKAAIPEVAVFRTTRLDSIPAGKAWLEVIHQRLRTADLILVLLTPSSVRRPWISFETGAAWMRDVVLVPGVAGMAKTEVPEPLRSLQLRSLDDVEEAAEAVRELGGTLKDPDTFAAAVNALSQQGVRTALEDEGWEYIEFNGKRYAWDGPFDRLSKASPAPLPDGLIPELQNAGLKPVTGVPDDLYNEYSKGFQQVFEVDRHHRMREIVSRDKQVLLVKRVG